MPCRPRGRPLQGQVPRGAALSRALRRAAFLVLGLIPPNTPHPVRGRGIRYSFSGCSSGHPSGWSYGRRCSSHHCCRVPSIYDQQRLMRPVKRWRRWLTVLFFSLCYVYLVYFWFRVSQFSSASKIAASSSVERATIAFSTFMVFVCKLLQVGNAKDEVIRSAAGLAVSEFQGHHNCSGTAFVNLAIAGPPFERDVDRVAVGQLVDAPHFQIGIVNID